MRFFSNQFWLDYAHSVNQSSKDCTCNDHEAILSRGTISVVSIYGLTGSSSVDLTSTATIDFLALYLARNDYKTEKRF